MLLKTCTSASGPVRGSTAFSEPQTYTPHLCPVCCCAMPAPTSQATCSGHIINHSLTRGCRCRCTRCKLPESTSEQSRCTTWVRQSEADVRQLPRRFASSAAPAPREPSTRIPPGGGRRRACQAGLHSGSIGNDFAAAGGVPRGSSLPAVRGSRVQCEAVQRSPAMLDCGSNGDAVRA